MKSAISAFVFSLVVYAGNSLAEPKPFQIKGLSIGLPSAQACGTAKVTNNFADVLRKFGSETNSLIDMNTTECEVKFTTFAGNSLTEPAQLLFLADQLIFLQLHVKQLSLSSFLEIHQALIDDYGKPKRTIFRPLVIDTWKLHGETLTLERLGREWDDNDATITLRQDSGYRIYENRRKTNTLVLQKLDAQRVKRDIR